ncbi:hypothetical protein BB776_02375 [Planococcus salinarum]|uniref:Uncharacterized protein n=1 Tax=Planococcus salinarum TaxID=622695 RepID=A0ABX3D239_9BACL|nr:hypothetical protein [Planococcus salinarum]OHX52244.1 hypothetical protein BB776_02375 [Planococcus salinarum]TAA73249.1 hypothetical protein D2909_02755 [Planococcus salinarum]
MKTETKQLIAAETAKSIYDAHPKLWERFGEKGFIHTEKDNHHHLDHLETAFGMEDEAIFLEYTTWLESVLRSRGVETDLIVDNFERLMKILPGKVEAEEETFMLACLEKANALLQQP